MADDKATKALKELKELGMKKFRNISEMVQSPEFVRAEKAVLNRYKDVQDSKGRPIIDKKTGKQVTPGFKK